MKFLVSTVLIALLSLLSGLYLPWWGLALVAALIAILIPLRPGFAFLSGFLALFLLWGLLAWLQDAPNKSLLSSKIALILPLGGSPWLLILVTALVGALVGGTAALTGSLLKSLSKPTE
jgi:hypothetical protein